MAGWVAIASPLLFRLGGDKGPFDSGQPVEGLLRLGAVLGVLICLAARRKVDPGAPSQASLLNRAAVGPFVGGLLLVTITGFTALGDTSNAVIYGALLAAAIVMVLVRFVVPPLGVIARRALIGPFVIVAAGLYWSFIELVFGTHGATSGLRDRNTVEAALLFLVAFSAVYYAMLIYAPRQIAEREGRGVEWVLRYLLFVVSIVLGIGWLGVLST